MSAILAAIISASVSLFQWLFGGKQQSAGVAQGRAEAERDQAVKSANTEASIAQAAANAPRTKADVEKRLSNGTF